jgi:DNA-binding CsgD family transcriptional regulator
MTTLTPRERDIHARALSGETNKSIAAELGLSVRTVEAHRLNAARKLGASSTALTQREQEVLSAIEVGESPTKIAHRLGLSVKTVDSHRAAGLARISASNHHGAIR